MSWHIGQEVVCVKSHPEGVIKSGKTYTIKALRMSLCNCFHTLIDVGFYITPERPSICGKCHRIHNTGGVAWFHESRFAPLDGDISELIEILEQPIKQNIEIINK